MFTAIIRKLYIRSKQWFKHPGWHLKLSFNNFIFFVDFFTVFVLFCSFFFIKIKKGCPQTIAGLSSVDILALVLRVPLGLVIMVTLESSGPIDYIASLFVHKSCIFPFHNQVSDEAIDSITAGILMSLISYKRRVLLREIQYQTAYMYIRSNEGLTLKTSIFKFLYCDQFILSTQLIKPNYLSILPTDAPPQFL